MSQGEAQMGMARSGRGERSACLPSQAEMRGLVSIPSLRMGHQGLRCWESSDLGAAGEAGDPSPLHPLHLSVSPGAAVTRRERAHGNGRLPAGFPSSLRLPPPSSPSTSQSAAGEPATAVVEWSAGADVTGGRGWPGLGWAGPVVRAPAGCSLWGCDPFPPTPASLPLARHRRQVSGPSGSCLLLGRPRRSPRPG